MCCAVLCCVLFCFVLGELGGFGCDSSVWFGLGRDRQNGGCGRSRSWSRPGSRGQSRGWRGRGLVEVALRCAAAGEASERVAVSNGY
ncbi:hypothetical protein B0I37DRAFT_369651 [Chaetomium sp. MPI-CAGE-AT-0009]|nr:hypothetical protein B0I37DRAFT_369651 [Chaetomium sp. MPI-CAGE-AT-0009]